LIGYLKGTLLKKEEDRILLLVSQVGYEILLPAVVMETLAFKKIGDEAALYIFYQQTERQPKPILIGFNLEAEREFFQKFVSVEDIGPLKAVKALNIPIRDIARAIETGDVTALTRLKGIGRRTAQKIVATLSGKMEKFALIRKPDVESLPPDPDFIKPVMDVLTEQLGHRASEAKRMVADALRRNPEARTPEALFEEVYRGEMLR